MRTVWLLLVVAVATLTMGPLVILADLLGVPRRPGGIYDWAPRVWARAIVWASGVELRIHGAEALAGSGRRVVVANHVSWFDIPVMVLTVPRFAAVAKQELSRIWFFGRGAAKVGVVYIDRDNRKAAFEAYEAAAGAVREQRNVVVFPEGTRGHEYALRPFKKGPFVLAVAAQSDVVPVVIHGTLPLGRGKDWRVDPSHVQGVVDVHVLPAVSADGATYADRNAIASRVHARMAEFLHTHYAVPPRDAPTLSDDASHATPPSKAAPTLTTT
ncbi:MAG: 1-acyl-sn-glycerol-3-phosphate acyltransferase [Gemmatimonadaceae bacterium]|jgi:1-acyl-sn-glycerol-3-phosphate acyltransferase|nr:1-acyl-sn-glycerol-3-phosphate acyltransferase [Gemmatimonadaceae bacterium]